MIKYTVFPYLKLDAKVKANPYIHDFVRSLNDRSDSTVVNYPHKNPLLSILYPKRWGDVFIFNWFESIPDFKWGIFQSIIAVLFVLILSIFKKKIVWVLHNKMPHSVKHQGFKMYLMSFIAKRSTIIITHASDGVELVKKHFPSSAQKIYYLDHPTKNRLDLREECSKVVYDLLIWGHISKYKGVFEFVDFIMNNQLYSFRICILGKFPTKELYLELKNKVQGNNNISIIDHSPSFEELGGYISRSSFVMAPYIPDSILSSGMLMDSLSMGAKVIGPHVGSFKDYANENRLRVYTFDKFCDIPILLEKYKSTDVSIKSYTEFLEENNWNRFADKLSNIIKNL